jgi:hypothetical protein
VPPPLEFAEQHSFLVKRSPDDDTDNIVGKYGEIYEYDDETLGVRVIPEPPRRGLWVRSREKFEALGMTITQNGDQEGAAMFDPSDPRQSKAAIKAIQAKKRWKLLPERRARLLVVGQSTRLKPGHMAQNAL